MIEGVAIKSSTRRLPIMYPSAFVVLLLALVPCTSQVRDDGIGPLSFPFDGHAL